MKEKVEEALNKIRPMLMADGGNVDLVEVTDDGIVKLKLTGACGSCRYGSNRDARASAQGIAIDAKGAYRRIINV